MTKTPPPQVLIVDDQARNLDALETMLGSLDCLFVRAESSDQALLALYKNFPAVKKLIRLNGGNAADAEDIFQEALIILRITLL